MIPALLALALATPSLADEPAPTAEALRARLDEALALWPDTVARRVDPTALAAAADALRAALPAVADVLDAETAARVHAVVGLGAWVTAGGRDDALVAFAAARRADPAWRLGDAWPDTAETARLLEAYEAVPPTLGCAHPVPRPASGALLFDGRADGARSDAWPTLWQAVDARGRVTATAWLDRDDPVPAYRRAPPKGAWALLGTGLGLAVAGAALGAVEGPAFAACADARLAGERVACDDVVAGVNIALTLGGVGVALAAGGGGWVGAASRARPWSTPHLDAGGAP